MLSIPVRAIIAAEDIPGITPEHRIYLLKDHEARMLYVGQSIHPVERMQEHLGLTWRGAGDQVGALIDRQAPASYEWLVELYTLEECRPFFEAWKKTLSASMQEIWKQIPGAYHIDFVESALIQLYHPSLNKTYNTAPALLPEQYIDQPTESSGTYLRKKKGPGV